MHHLHTTNQLTTIITNLSAVLSKILLVIQKICSVHGIVIAFLMQCFRQKLWATVEYTNLFPEIRHKHKKSQWLFIPLLHC